MPSTPPDGQPVPGDGSLPGAALATLGQRGFGAYVHVPFCASRCGYCDFNTYTPSEAGDAQGSYVDAVLAEIDLAATVLGGTVLGATVLGAGVPHLDTVFFGGGTPTMVDVRDLTRILDRLAQTFGLADGAEVSTEANPESVDLASLRHLRASGFTRVSLGMQSTAPHVLAVLERRHRPGRAAQAAAQARAAGFEHVNLDLIYATPGESARDFADSLQAALHAGVDHISAYSLIVEPGTRLAARIKRGELPAPDDDVAADRYLAADAALAAAGFAWYEVSNWARSPAGQCRHNMTYWGGGDWWGFGPGAHSHAGGVRWWNVRHPAAYAGRLASGATPAEGREILGEEDRRVEQVMLGLRLASGLAMAVLTPSGLAAAADAVREGLLCPDGYGEGRAVLTLRGRLLADGLVVRLLG